MLLILCSQKIDSARPQRPGITSPRHQRSRLDAAPRRATKALRRSGSHHKSHQNNAMKHRTGKTGNLGNLGNLGNRVLRTLWKLGNLVWEVGGNLFWGYSVSAPRLLNYGRSHPTAFCRGKKKHVQTSKHMFLFLCI